jgi:hypothetical protein
LGDVSDTPPNGSILDVISLAIRSGAGQIARSGGIFAKGNSCRSLSPRPGENEAGHYACFFFGY